MHPLPGARQCFYGLLFVLFCKVLGVQGTGGVEHSQHHHAHIGKEDVYKRQGQCDLGGVVVHQHHVSGLNGSVRAQSAHCNAHIGINDAPVLSRADVGIAMGALGSDAAIEAADVVLMDDDPAKIALAMRIARRTLRIVYQNIVFALAIKFACLVLGAVGMASMWTAIFADVGVMVLAVLNATRALYTRDLARKNEL